MGDERKETTSAPTRPGSGPRNSTQPAVPSADLVGEVLAERYRVLKKIGEGGMGTVYLAEHVRIEKKVAIKVLSGDYARRGDLVTRFEQEAKSASKIGHENIVDITDFGETKTGSPFFVMEHLEGKDLGHFLRNYGAMSIYRSVRILGQVCRALGAAHAKGIVHRDLKPENIFLIERGGRADFVKVLDFGIAKVSSMTGGKRLTVSGTIFGTAEYMSPEQGRGDPADHRTDVYAAGCILYEMLVGDVPFRAQSFMDVLHKQLKEEPTPPSLRKPDAGITPALEAVVLKALAKDREQRFQTMSELAFALADATGEDPREVWGGQEVLEPRTTKMPVATPQPSTRIETPLPKNRTPTPAPEPARSRAGLWWVLGGAVVLGGAGFAAWLSVGRGGPTLLNQEKPVVATPPSAPVEKPKGPATFKMSIVTTPDHVEVRNGAERMGYTPLVFTLPANSAKMTVTLEKKGYKSQKLDLQPDHDREYVLQLPHLVEKKTSVTSKPSESTPKKPSELKDID